MRFYLVEGEREVMGRRDKGEEDGEWEWWVTSGQAILRGERDKV